VTALPMPVKRAGVGIKGSVPIQRVDTRTSVVDVEGTIKEAPASESGGKEKDVPIEATSMKKPRFHRLMWTKGEAGLTPAATYTETAAPLPDVPVVDLENDVVTNTLTNHPDLLKIVTPLNIDEMEKMLITHPNQVLVESLLTGLRRGFWPSTDTMMLGSVDDEPVQHQQKLDDSTVAFLRTQRDLEMRVG